MLDVHARAWGNPSSPHASGRAARAVLDEARDAVAAAIGGEPREIVFTSGGTEAINLAVKGAAWAGRATGERIVTTGVEHDAVLNACRFLERFGFIVDATRPTPDGAPDPDRVIDTLGDRTVLVTLQVANNEVGTIVDVAGLVPAIRRYAPHALIHLDAVQAAPWTPLDVRSIGADLVSLSGHKLEGPKGIGVLWVRRGTVLVPQAHGGGQERYLRAGTEHVAGAAGMARALTLAVAERPSVPDAVRTRRDRLLDGLLALPGVTATGAPRDRRLPNHCSVVIDGVRGDDLVVALDLAGVAASTGSACASGSGDPSHVLIAMGFDPETARGALRLTLGRTTTDAEIEVAIGVVGDAVARLRAAAPALGVATAGRIGG